MRPIPAGTWLKGAPATDRRVGRGAALVALWCALSGFAAPQAAVPLQGLTEEDVGADGLKNALCYAHDGSNVLLVAAERNAIVSSEGSLRLLQRKEARAPLSAGAQYAGTRFLVSIVPEAVPAADPAAPGRRDFPAQIAVRQGSSSSSVSARWNCKLQ